MIRPMKLSDVPRVAEIHIFGWRSAFRGIVPDEVLFGRMSVQRSMERFEDSFAADNSHDTYVYDDGIIKGWTSAGPCRDEDEPQAFEIGAIYIEPCMKDSGIGTKLVIFCEEIAAQRGYSKICIWTLENNALARAFYEKLGYVHDGAKKYMDNLYANSVRYKKLMKDVKIC